MTLIVRALIAGLAGKKVSLRFPGRYFVVLPAKNITIGKDKNMAKMNIFQKIKLGLQVYGEVKRMNKGLFTTEFWFSIITVIGLLLSVFLDKIPPASLILVVGLLPSIYTIARTLAKKTSSTLDDEIIEKIEQAILKKLPGYVEPPHE